MRYTHFCHMSKMLKYEQSSRESIVKWTFQSSKCKNTLFKMPKPRRLSKHRTVFEVWTALFRQFFFCRSLKTCQGSVFCFPLSPLPHSHSFSFTISLLPFCHRNKHHIFGSFAMNYKFCKACQSCCRLFMNIAMLICWQRLPAQYRIDLLLVCSSVFCLVQLFGWGGETWFLFLC